MYIDPSQIVYYEKGFTRITATLVYTWILIVILGMFSYFATRKLTSEAKIGKVQNILEAFIAAMQDQIEGITGDVPKRYLPFVGTIFIFVLISNIFSVIPGFIAPTGSLNTTIALALAVLVAVPFYGIRSQGVINYFKEYTRPNILMLPFHIISEISRTISLAVRLYGNIMSGSVVSLIIITVIPLVFPVLLDFLGLIIGIIQAYIFAVLSIVYIASNIKSKEKEE